MDVRFGHVTIYRSSRNNYEHPNYRPYVEQQLALIRERLGDANVELGEIPFRKPLIIATNENGTDHATRLKNQWPAKGRSKTSSRANLASYVPLITADIDDDPKALFRLMEVDGYLDTFVPTPKPVPTPEASEASPSPTPVEESPADPAG